MIIKNINNNELFFTSDEHFDHFNILRFCDRPFTSIEEMNETIISNFNSVVPKKSTTIHGGDFYLGPLKRDEITRNFINRLNGTHIFMMGNHDRWLKGDIKIPYIIDVRLKDVNIVISHYAMRTWNRSHFNSWHLYGHSHGTLEPIGKSWDMGVDFNNFFPLSFEDVRGIMESRPDNPNLVKTKEQ